MPVISNRVQCLVTGEQTLRFVNICRNNGIELRHLIRKENAIQMEIDAKNFKKLRPLVRKTHVKYIFWIGRDRLFSFTDIGGGGCF